MSRIPRQRAGAAILAVALVAGAAATSPPTPAEAQEPRTVTVSPDGPYQPNQQVKVSWSGFEPGWTSIVMCERVAADAGNRQGCADATHRVGLTGPDGTGSIDDFRVHSHPPAMNYTRNSGVKTCAFASGGNFCTIVVSECDLDIRPQHAARNDVDLAFVPPASRPAWPAPPPARDAPAEPENDAPGPGLPPGSPSLRAARSKLSEEGTDAWVKAIADRQGVLLDVVSLSSVETNAAMTVGLAPVGFTALPLEEEEHLLLEAQGVSYTYVPVGISALAVGVGFQWAGGPVTEVNLPADVLARIYGTPPDSGENPPISQWNDAAITEANGGCNYPPTPSGIRKIYRGDQSAANKLFMRYLYDLEGGILNLEPDVPPGPRFPLEDSLGTSPFLTNDEIATSLYRGTYSDESAVRAAGDKVDGDGQLPLSNARVGYVELGTAQDAGLTIATITNGAGEPVRPTPEAILAGLTDPPEDGLLGDDDVFFPDFEGQPADAYPMPFVVYAVVPTSHEGLPTTADGQPDVAWGQRLVDALEFMVSDEGQAVVADQGWVPLPEAFVAAAERGIDAIPTEPAPAPTGGTPTGFSGGGFGAGGLGSGLGGDFSSGLGGTFDGGFGDGFGTGGGEALAAEPVSESSSAGEEDEDSLAARRLDDPDIAPTVGALALAAVVVLVAGRALVLSSRRRKAGSDAVAPASEAASA
jgi:ABC-type phosphate transport system substrate-binding protein